MAATINYSTKTNKAVFYTLVILLLLSLFSTATQAQKIFTERVFRYDIFSDEGDIGDSHTQVTRLVDGSYSILEQSHIQTSGWWGELNLRSNLLENYSNQGQLIGADSKIFDGEIVYWQRTDALGKELHSSIKEIDKLSKKEQQPFISITKALANASIPSVGDVKAVSRLLFIKRKGSSVKFKFAKQDFDSSFNNLPFYWAANGQALPAKMRLFDSESLKITKYTVSQINDHFQLQSKRGNNFKLGFAIDVNGIPYFTQILGENDDGPFRIQLKINNGKDH